MCWSALRAAYFPGRVRAPPIMLDPYGACVPDTDHSTKTDVGSLEGTTWSLSSAKARNGVSQLMDDDLDTLWQ